MLPHAQDAPRLKRRRAYLLNREKQLPNHSRTGVGSFAQRLPHRSRSPLAALLLAAIVFAFLAVVTGLACVLPQPSQHSATPKGRSVSSALVDPRNLAHQRFPTVSRKQYEQVRDIHLDVNPLDKDVDDLSKYKRLSPREHVLLRPDTYIGSTSPQSRETWLLMANGSAMEQRAVTYSPGFLKIFDEILVNAMDQQYAVPRRKSRAKTTEITVDVDAKTQAITVTNDGVGIPVEWQNEFDAWVPSSIYGEMLTGSNFDDDDKPRFVGGRNGVGAKATNVFSKEFTVEVVDPASKRRFTQTWSDNMQNPSEPVIEENVQAKTGRVSVQFVPDLKRFGMSRLDRPTVELLRARTLDAAACTGPSIKVTFNGKGFAVQSFADYARLVFGDVEHVIATVKEPGPKGHTRLEVAVGLSPTKGFRSIGFVNGIRCHAGTHVDVVVKQLVADTIEHIGKQRSGQTARVQPQFVKEHLFVVVKALVENPSFESQSKDHLATPEGQLGFDPQLPKTFLNKVRRMGLAKIVQAFAVFKEETRSSARLVSKGDLHRNVPKLEDASYAGVAGHNCTLILTEGDSAKAMVLGALEGMPGSRDHYGIFPLRGKMKNVRKANAKALSENAGVKELMQVFGLQLNKQYRTVAAPALRYQKVMVFADQDHDGDHITGLIINFFSSLWPSIFDVEPRFVVKFVTPLVKVLNEPGVQFFSMQEWEQWSAQQKGRKLTPKYYKGLGTSSDTEAAEYFQNLEKHTLALEWAGQSDDAVLQLVFDSTRADDRKDWLLKTFNPDGFLDYSRDVAPHRDFFEQSFIHYSMYDCQRSIPHLIDGLKISQRKAMTVALTSLKSDTKVTVFSNLVMSAMKYHHGDASMTETIVRLAQTHVGTNNVNFLRPHGQFGSRLNDRGEHAQARYIGVELEPIAKKIFRREDEPILEYQVDEMAEVEPRYLLPVVPTVLLNGASGIGTGWSTEVPNFNPLSVILAMRNVLDGEAAPQLLEPWYDGYRGEIFTVKGKFMSAGKWQVGMSSPRKKRPDAIAITELPVGVWTDAYRERLSKTSLQNITKGIDTSRNGKSTVNLVLKMDPQKLEAFLDTHNDDWKLGRALGLIRGVPARFCLWNVSSKLQTFDNTDEVIRSFYKTRLPMYQRRLDHMLEKANREVIRTRGRVEFIQCVVNGSLSLLPPPSADQLCKQLLKMGFETMPGYDARGRPTGNASFDYLLGMTFTSLTRENAKELKAQLKSKQAHLLDLQRKAAEDLWRQDLDELEEAYKQFRAAKQSQNMASGEVSRESLPTVVATSSVKDFLVSGKSMLGLEDPDESADPAAHTSEE